MLEQVARDAGYTRGALYHQFKDKEDLALAVLDWVDETLERARSASRPSDEPTPVAALLALARGHAVFCRRDIARVVMALRVEFSGQDHPVGRALERVSATLRRARARLIKAGRRDGSIPPGPPARDGRAGVPRRARGRRDRARRAGAARRLLAARAAAGVLGLSGAAA